MIKKIFKPNIIYLALFVTLLILPFSFSDRSDEIKAVEMNTENIGYYQSTTCKISLTEFILKNIETNEKIYFNNNNYVDVSCFGKITGVDYVSGTTIVSIGTNTSINQIIQSAFWLLIILFIPKNKQHMLNFSKFIFFIPLLFTFQIFAENRFYEKSNSIFNDTISYTNLYLIGNLIFYLLLTILIWDTLNLRYKNLVNYLPFIFLVIDIFQLAMVGVLIIIGQHLASVILVLLVIPQITFQEMWLLRDPLKFDVKYQASAQPFLITGMLVTALAIGHSFLVA